MTTTVRLGGCIEVMRTLPDSSVDAIVTDPPYGLGFMGKAWDTLPPGEEWARECLRVLKPGGHLLAFGGTRTWHRLAVAVEDAGFELRDSIAWLYGSGFPKSHDVSKAIDRAAGAEREVVGINPRAAQQTAKLDATSYGVFAGTSSDLTAPATPDAKRWKGWGTALKPAFEPIVVARKPLTGTVAANVVEHGTGALNIDACRVAGVGEPIAAHHGTNGASGVTFGNRREYVPGSANAENVHTAGRWPTNVVLDGHAADALDQQSGYQRGGGGGASRFFPTFRYQAKAPARERPKVDGVAHPTVKPLELMRWLVRLVTPPGGVVLDPFAGSGTTVEAAMLEGMECIAIEREADYIPLIMARIERSTT